jgi:HEAT repeat protein/uncharacterized protein YegL
MDSTRSLLAYAFLAILALPAATATPDAIDDLTAKIRSNGDSGDAKWIGELAGHQSRRAAEALIGLYDEFHTVYMQREIVRVLTQFDGIADAEQPALQKLTDVATQASSPELREAALDSLGRCASKGKDFLAFIVQSPVEDSVRERAMENHVHLSDRSDFPWYREIYKPTPPDEKTLKEQKEKEKEKEKKEKKAKKKGDAEQTPPERKLYSLNSLRFMAFQAVSSDLTPDELVAAAHDDYYKIQSAALLDLEKRADPRTLELATDRFKQLNGRAEPRAIAAQVMGRLAGTKVADEFVKRAKNVDTPRELRFALADILVGFKDAEIDRQLVLDIGKGRPEEKIFVLHAVRDFADEKVNKAVHKQLTDKEPEVILAACELLGHRRDKEALPLFQKMVEKGKDPVILRAVFDAMAAIRADDPAWVTELTALTANADSEVRSIALEALGKTGDKATLEKLIAALNDPNWSVRLTALEGLESLRLKEGVGAIIERMGKEEGRMLHDMASALYRLTGQPYQDNATNWANWWQKDGTTFEVLSKERFERIHKSETEYALKQTTRGQSGDEWRLKKVEEGESKFFGIQIISHRVLFVIDVSGSMEEVVRNEFLDGAPMTRLQVAKRELKKCIEALEPGAFFNIVTFSSGVERWMEGALAAANPENREKAQAFVTDLLTGGGTNLYDAVRNAFEDQDVDTIYIMSDGEPSDGAETEPFVIREHIAQWNEHRQIEINTIAIGGQFQILEWLAEDSGGTHVKFE